jgi:hypothetical protein
LSMVCMNTTSKLHFWKNYQVCIGEGEQLGKSDPVTITEKAYPECVTTFGGDF